MAYTAKTAKQLREQVGSLLRKLADELKLIETELAALSAGFPGGYATIRLGAGGALPTATLGATEASPAETSTNKINYQYLDFDPATQKYCQWQFSMPHDYDGGTITAKVKWGAASGAGDAIWGIQGVCIGDSVALDSAFGSAVEVTDTLVATADLQVSAATGAITLAGTPVADKWTVIQLYRKAADGSDTLTTNARMVEVLLTYARLTS
jgi:hypothetical protein